MRSLIFCIVFFMSAAHAQLTSPQMKSAHSRIEKGNLIQVQLDCPYVSIPEKITTSEQLDKLEQEFTAYEACFQNILDHTYQPNLASLLEIEYPSATIIQRDELLSAVQRAVAPIRATKKQAFLEVKTKAQIAARPFLLKQQLIEGFDDRCTAPPLWDTLHSVKQAKQWVDDVRTYHDCLGDLANNVGRQNAHEFVTNNFAKESESIRMQLVFDFPMIQKEIVKRLLRPNEDISRKFTQAGYYIKSNGKTMNGPGED